MNVIQMTLMKVMYNIENMIAQEFRRCIESQLIEAMSID
jgi:hypothetical protein